MSRYFNLTVLVMLGTMLSCALSHAQDSRTPPTRVNTDSIRTASGGALFQAIRPRESVSDYRGGFLHIYPGHNVAQAISDGDAASEPVTQGQFVQGRTPETDLLPPLPGNDGEEVMGIIDPSIDGPVFSDPEGVGVPVDGYYDGVVGGPIQHGKHGKGFHGKGGKGKHGQLGYHDWNWACFCIPMPPEDNFSINFGAHGFKGPLNASLDGSFGFHEGFNLGAALPGCHLGIGWQIGLQGVHSNQTEAGFPESSRDQTFFTWGFFRRVDYGLQGGFVFDHMHDDYMDEVSLDQVRGEVSWVTCCGSEFGVFFNVSGDRSETEYDIEFGDGDFEYEIEADVEVTDIVALFYRRYFGACRESWGRIYVGATEERGSLSGLLELSDNNPEIEDLNLSSSFVFGAEMHVALSTCWAMETGFTWLTAPSDDERGAFEESWNVGFNLIWMPRGHCCGTTRGYYRPLFNVADNGTFLTHISEVDLDFND